MFIEAPLERFRLRNENDYVDRCGRRYAVLDHMGLAVKDYARSKAFYQQALAPLGLTLLMEPMGETAGFGEDGKPSFRIEARGRPVQGRLHVAFAADSTVDAFYAAALKAGGTDNGAPGAQDLPRDTARTVAFEERALARAIFDTDESSATAAKRASRIPGWTVTVSSPAPVVQQRRRGSRVGCASGESRDSDHPDPRDLRSGQDGHPECRVAGAMQPSSMASPTCAPPFPSGRVVWRRAYAGNAGGEQQRGGGWRR